MDQYLVVATIYEGDLALETFFTNKPSCKKVNDFNGQYRWTRVYLDAKGELTVSTELSFTGGITLEGVDSFVSTYGVILDKISEHFQ